MKRGAAVKTEMAPATVSEADGVRYLHLGTPWVQGAMRLRKPLALELEYVQRMMVWLLMMPGEAMDEEAEAPQKTPGHAVQFGLGAASISRFTHGVLRMQTTAVECNPSVIHVCRLCFHLPDDSARFRVVEQDAGAYAADAAHAGSAQALCVDLYDDDAASPVLDSAAFYQDCHRLLAPHGVMTVNLFGRDASFARSARRIADAFGDAHVFSLRPTREGNTVVAGLKGFTLPAPEVLAARADNIESRFKLPAKKWLKMIRPYVADPPAAFVDKPAR